MRAAPASTHDLDAAYAVIVECRDGLEVQGIMQWDLQYPSRSFLHDALADGNLFALFDDNRIRGVVVLDESQPVEWAAATWKEPGRFLVIHAFAISPCVQGCGLGKTLLAFCEKFAREKDYASIRLDAFSENPVALRFYEKHGYFFRGQVQFASKPLGHRLYRCYEKSLA